MAQKSRFQYLIAKTNYQKIKFAMDCMDNSLYVNGWGFIDWLSEIIEFDNRYEIGICFCDNLPIGCSIINPDGHIGFFVKESYRRMGIATKLCECMRSEFSENKYLYVALGIDGSDKFFEWVGLNVEN